jgi:hypothetical protein
VYVHGISDLMIQGATAAISELDAGRIERLTAAFAAII